MNNEEFESELHKLKPAKFLGPSLGSQASSLPVQSQARSLRSQGRSQITHSVAILLGILLGAGLVHFLQQPVIIEKVVIEYVESPPPAPVEKPLERPGRSDFAQVPLSIDTMIEQYNQRNRLLADLPVSRFTSSRSPAAWGSDDPNSLLKLREQL